MDVYAALFLLMLAVVALIVLWILVSNFKQKSQSRQEYGVATFTLKGEIVRSIGEKRIADYFARNNINYIYEQEATGRSLFHKFRIGIPDFYLPDYGVYVEYWGLVNADNIWTRERYIRHMKRKMAVYHKNNIKFISIYPQNLESLDWVFKAKLRKVTGYESPNQNNNALS